MRTEYKTMKIPSDIKKRMDLLKGRKTYAEYWDSILSYFEMTGVDPTYGQLPPSVTIVKALKEETSIVYRRVEDMIKILRNIEANKIDGMIHALDSLIKGKTFAAGADDSTDIGLKEQEIYQVVQINETQEKLITQQKKEINRLKMENEALKTNNFNKGPEVVELVEELLSDRILGKEGVLTKEHKAQLVEKIKHIAYV